MSDGWVDVWSKLICRETRPCTRSEHHCLPRRSRFTSLTISATATSHSRYDDTFGIRSQLTIHSTVLKGKLTLATSVGVTSTTTLTGNGGFGIEWRRNVG
jgi:hypothetical protein